MIKNQLALFVSWDFQNGFCSLVKKYKNFRILY